MACKGGWVDEFGKFHEPQLDGMPTKQPLCRNCGGSVLREVEAETTELRAQCMLLEARIAGLRGSLRMVREANLEIADDIEACLKEDAQHRKPGPTSSEAT